MELTLLFIVLLWLLGYLKTSKIEAQIANLIYYNFKILFNFLKIINNIDVFFSLK